MVYAKANRKVLWFVAGLAFAFVATVEGVSKKTDYANPPQGVFVDEWMLVNLGENKVGYMHSEVSRQGDTISTYNLMSVSLKRVGSPVTITQIQTSKETVSGKPLAFSREMDASLQKMHVHGKVVEDRVRVVTSQYGSAITNEYTFPSGALMAWGVLKVQMEKGFAKGTIYDLALYEPSLAADIAIRMEVEILGEEVLVIDKVRIPAIRMIQKLSYPGLPDGIMTVAWVNAEGTVLKTEIPIMGMHMTSIRCSKDDALREFTPPEFFMPTAIKVNRRIDRKKATRIVYNMSLKDNTFIMPKIPQTAMQTAVTGEDGTVRLTVERLSRDRLRDVENSEYGSSFDDYLQPNGLINSEDPEVKAMAKAARGTASTPYELGDALRRYVSDIISDKNMDVGFASASEVCRNRAGDCSEHAVLLAALGRANGLPSRIACGLVYVPVFGGDHNVFGFHMWTQFYIGGQWVDFDAAQNESNCNPTHIALVVTSLNEEGMAPLAMGLATVVGNLELEVVEIVPVAP